MGWHRWSEEAFANLMAIREYIAEDDPAAADSWVAKLRKRAAAAAKLPTAGRIVPELGRGDVREVFLKTYRIVYRVKPGGIVVLAVFEGHRQLGTIKLG